MRFLLSCLIIVFIHCTLSAAFRLNNYLEVHEVDRNKVGSIEQLPPEDPAKHSFPTAPSVPLVPTCAKKGYFRDPFNCGKFYYCKHKNAVPIGFYCQAGLIFNTDTEICDPNLVVC